MSESFEAAAFRAYIAATFPCAQLEDHPIDFGSVRLRFELGGQHPNGSDERITQATERATTLFQQCNSANDKVVLLIKSFEMRRRDVRRTTPSDHMSCLMSCVAPDTGHVKPVSLEGAQSQHRQLLLQTIIRNIDCRRVFEAISHREQGRTPVVSQAVYIVNRTNNIVFYMYDDRGCLIYADSPNKLQRLYSRHNAWLVDHDRDRHDTIFGS